MFPLLSELIWGYWTHTTETSQIFERKGKLFRRIYGFLTDFQTNDWRKVFQLLE